MCELLAVSSGRKIKVNALLKTFFDRSDEHPNGWGLAILDGNNVSLEREPVKAKNSLYLKNRLSANIVTSNLLAHIRNWVLMHNGTIFDSPVISAYQYRQIGSTDSERVLLYLVDQVNKKILDDMNFFDVNERFKTVESVIAKLSPENKLNLVIHDGEYLYVHKNDVGTLFMKEVPGGVIFATHPLDNEDWTEAPDNQLLVYKDGECVYKGHKHSYTYEENEEQTKLLYLGFSGL